MNYGLFKKSGLIKKISGKPLTPKNQKNLIVWHPSKKQVISWVKDYGTLRQKKLNKVQLTKRRFINDENKRNC